jgi:rod shape-determining protein MreD
MTFYLLLPLSLLLMVVLQVTLLDRLFFGKAGIELVIIFVVYAGLCMKPLPGGLLCFLVGYLMDCVSGSLSGLHASIYVVIFLMAKLYFFRIHADRSTVIALFCFFGILAEGFIVLGLYNIVYGMTVWRNILAYTLPQAMVGALLSPVLFNIFNRIEVFLGYGHTGPFGRP